MWVIIFTNHGVNDVKYLECTYFLRRHRVKIFYPNDVNIGFFPYVAKCLQNCSCRTLVGTGSNLP